MLSKFDDKVRLALVDPSKPIFSDSDACDTGYGGMAFQAESVEDFFLKPPFKILHHQSKGFDNSMAKKSTFEKELFGHVNLQGAIQHLLYGHVNIMRVDQKSLIYMTKMIGAGKINQRCFTMLMSLFSSVAARSLYQHIPGVDNVFPDYESRIPHFIKEAMKSQELQMTNVFMDRPGGTKYVGGVKLDEKTI